MAAANELSRAAGARGEPQLAITFGDSRRGASAASDRELTACVLDLTVDQTLDQADHLTMRLAARAADTGHVAWIDDARFAAGAALAVKLGQGDSLAQVFDGEIVGVGVELRGGEPAVVTVDAYNRIHRLGRGRRPPAARPESKTTYGSIVGKLAQRHGLTAKVEGSDADQPNDTVVQQNESDLAFLARLAEEIGYSFHVEGMELVFRKDTPPTALALAIPASELIEFSGHADPSSQIGVIDGSAFDHDANRSIPYRASNPDSFDRVFGSEEIVIAQPFAVDRKDQLQARVEAELRRVRNQYLAATATGFVRTDVKLGMLIAITGIARRFDGDYTVTAVTQSFSQTTGFRTRLTLKSMKGKRP